ncbi:MAG: glycoside hydrolase family 172 protein [Reyranellales bacterium]
MTAFNGLGLHLGNLSRLSDAKTRSISPENLTGAPGQGGRATEGTGFSPSRTLGQGWKVSPSILIGPGKTATLADIEGPGALQHIWMTMLGGRWRFLILRIYWDDQEAPSVECPVGDFFANGWGRYAAVNSLAVCVNPGRAFNCYWEMPFHRRCRVTLTNMDDVVTTLYYQIDYTLTEVPDDAAYFHASFRRTNPLPYKSDYTIIDGIAGKGHYVGTYMAWGSNNTGWWGEGEIKFFIDDDKQFPTICGTGTEDYFCGAYDFDIGVGERDQPHAYSEFSSPYAGLCQVIRPDGVYQSQQRFGMYRWHIMDPVRFETGLRVTIQALGWRPDPERRYLPLQDDLASVAFWYQALPTSPLKPLPERDYHEVI